MALRVIGLFRKSGSVAKNILKETVQLGKRAMYLMGIVLRPFRVQIDVTDGCNFRCPTCLKWIPTMSDNELDIKEWERIFGKIRDVPLLREVTICGGEPFTRPDIIKILELAKSNKLYTVVVTNGWYQNDAMMQQLYDMGVDRLMVSLNSLKESIHDESRQMPGSYRRILDLINTWQNQNSRIDLCLETLIMENNVEELSALANFVQHNRLNGVIYQVLAPPEAHYPFSTDSDMPTYPQDWFEQHPMWVRRCDILRNEVKTLLRMQKQGIPIINPSSQIKKFPVYYEHPAAIRRMPCLGMLTTLYIDPFGNMRLCYGFPPIGNILHDDPLRVWYSKFAQDLRKESKSCSRLCRMLNNNL